MARTQRAAAQSRINYGESSEEDNFNDATYDSEVYDSPAPTDQNRSSRATRASNRNKPSQRELSSEDHSDSQSSATNERLKDLEIVTEPPIKKRRVISPRKSKSKPSSSNTRNGPFSSATTRKSKKFSSKTTYSRKFESKEPKLRFESDGVIPLWSTLPYHVLLSIFDYAFSISLKENPRSPRLANSWLLEASKTCKAFFEPAMSALYRCPMFQSGRQLESFLTLVSSTNKDDYFITYNTKIKRLEIDERIMRHFQIDLLIQSLKTVSDIDIYSAKDRELRGNPSIGTEKYWKYPPNLFSTLAEFTPHLKSWQWNAEMYSNESGTTDIDQNSGYLLARNIEAPFSQLHHLQITNLFMCKGIINQGPTLRFMNESLVPLDWLPALPASNNATQYAQSHHETAVNFLQKSLQQQSRLQSLRLDFCGLICSLNSKSWLLALPTNLRKLQLHCCEGIISIGLQAYLEEKGNLLEVLILDHNECLNLDFLSHLKTSCPRLQELSMNLNYFSTFNADTVVHPGYHQILSDGYVPSWPSTLIKLNLNHLRKWDAHSAELFFESIVTADLPDLRSLYISAHVDINYRDRATFRDQWTSVFEKVFLRKSKPPSKDLQSLKTYRLYLERKRSSKPSKTDEISEKEKTRRLRPRNQVNYDDSSDDEGNGNKDNTMNHSTSGFDLKAEPGLKSGVKTEVTFNAGKKPLVTNIQGMCDNVSIRIDNQRPKERDIMEGDLIFNSDVSDDSDYEQ